MCKYLLHPIGNNTFGSLKYYHYGYTEVSLFKHVFMLCQWQKILDTLITLKCRASNKVKCSYDNEVDKNVILEAFFPCFIYLSISLLHWKIPFLYVRHNISYDRISCVRKNQGISNTYSLANFVAILYFLVVEEAKRPFFFGTNIFERCPKNLSKWQKS